MLSVVLQEAVATGNPSLVKLVMKYRTYGRNVHRSRGIPELLRKLNEVRLIDLLKIINLHI